MDGLIILLLFAALAVWLFGRIAKMLRVPVSAKRYGVVALIVVIGVLVLYASSH